MRARPYFFDTIKRTFVRTLVCDVTHLELIIPGPCGRIRIGVITKGNRDEASEARKEPVWTWNGSVDKPTLHPSLRTSGTFPLSDSQTAHILSGEKFEPTPWLCHTFVTDGQVIFLDDTTHDLRTQTLDLPEVD